MLSITLSFSPQHKGVSHFDSTSSKTSSIHLEVLMEHDSIEEKGRMLLGLELRTWIEDCVL